MDNVRVVEAPDPRVREYYEQRELDEIARKLDVPVSDDLVRRQLRSLSEPAELYGESKENRRDRLIKILAVNAKSHGSGSNEESFQTHERRPSFTSQGSDELLSWRERISQFVNQTRSNYQKKPLLQLDSLDILSTQSGFQRPIAAVSFCDENSLCVGDWSGVISVIGTDSSMPVVSQRETVGQISCISAARDSRRIASGYMDGQFNVLDHEGQIVLQTKAHERRITSVEFHKINHQLLLTASQDATWKLWDNDTPLLAQDGHSGPVNIASISADGSIVASGGADKQTRLWDLRSGARVAVLGGHADEIVALAWNPVIMQNTMEIAAAGADNRCLVWDLRNSSEPKSTIYAHSNKITALKYDESGSVLATSSLDGKLKIWSTDTYSLIDSVFTGTRVTGMDLITNKQNQFLLAAGRWDRMVDLYSGRTK